MRHPSDSGLRKTGRAAALLILTAVPWSGTAAESGHKWHLAIDYQFISVDGFESSVGELAIGTTDTHSLNLEVDYLLNDRWSISVGLPLVRKRYNGPGPHRPDTIVPPVDSEFIDDGEWHTNFQDFHVGVRYRLPSTGQFQFTPFVFLGVPSNDYPFFGHAAVGQNLNKLYLGTSITYQPLFSNFYTRVSPSYVFVEKTLGVSIDHWLIDGEVGYFVSPRLALKALFIYKQGKGATFPDDFPTPRTTELWYQHDRMVKHNYTNVGLGMDWNLDSANRLSFVAMTMTRAQQIHIVDAAFSLGWSRSF